MKIVAGFVLLLLAMPSIAADYQGEIEYLLVEIKKSDCTFHRNGSEHSSAEAADHLRMKYRRVGWRINSSEKFIDLLATKSYMTGSMYQLECQQGQLQPSGAWLYQVLKEKRAQAT